MHFVIFRMLCCSGAGLRWQNYLVGTSILGSSSWADIEWHKVTKVDTDRGDAIR